MLIWFYSDVHVRRSSGSFFSHFQLRNSEQLLSHWSASVMSAPDSTAPEFQDITSQTGNAEHKKWLNYKILRREETRRDALKPSEQNVSLFRCRSCCRGRGWRIPLLESSSPRAGFVTETFSDFPSGDLRVTPQWGCANGVTQTGSCFIKSGCSGRWSVNAGCVFRSLTKMRSWFEVLLGNEKEKRWFCLLKAVSCGRTMKMKTR